MKRVIIAPLVIVGMAMAYLKAYDVQPVKAQWSGWALGDENHGVSQTITCNFDSLVRVELFAGNIGSGGQYRVGVLENGSEIMWSTGNQKQDHSWIRFENWSTQVTFTKGKRYEFKFTRVGQDSIQYYYNPNNPYGYGILIDPNLPDPVPLGWDLCMRIYGKMDRVDSSYWGALVWVRDTVAARNNNVHGKVKAAGVHMDRIGIPWDWVWTDSLNNFDFTMTDPSVFYSHNTMGCKIIGILGSCPYWASSRYDSSGCPPRNLYLGVWDSRNYWARYVEGVVRHYYSDLGYINIYEIWNEPNNWTRFWRGPEYHYEIGPNQEDTINALCSLYARLCAVADSVIDSITQGEATVLIGSLVASQPLHSSRIPPLKMLGYCYRLADKRFWDGVSFHPYQDSGFNDINLFERQAESLRQVMRENGDYGELWITEIGTPHDVPDTLIGKEAQANCLGKIFVAAEGSAALPTGGYDRVCYYSFIDRDAGEYNYGMLDTLFQPKPAFYASCQTSSLLMGKSFNQRVIFGDGRDDSVRVYEFEDPVSQKRTWVGWKNLITPDSDVPKVAVRMPVRSDTVFYLPLDYDGTQPTDTRVTETDGWLEIDLSTRPVFLTEKSEVLRPDLRVDSIRLVPSQPQVGMPLNIYFWVKNYGNRSLPAGAPGGIAVYRNGTRLSPPVPFPDDAAIDQNCERAFVFHIEAVPDTWRGQNLFSVVVNPDRGFVE
ncbi:MAG: hypothetical protein ABIK49_04365, partial [candidate division WOR-3 bacterium]